jgi:putative membrane protein
MMFWYDHDMGGWGYAAMGIGMVLFWAVLIAGIVALIRFSGQQSGPVPPLELSAEQLLAARYARGEINDDEYRQKLSVLQGHART